MNRLSRPCCVVTALFSGGKYSTVTWGALWFTSPFITFLILPVLNSIWIIPLFSNLLTRRCCYLSAKSLLFLCVYMWTGFLSYRTALRHNRCIKRALPHSSHYCSEGYSSNLFLHILPTRWNSQERLGFFFFFSQTNLKQRSLRYSYKVMSGLQNIVSRNTTQLLIFH